MNNLEGRIVRHIAAHNSRSDLEALTRRVATIVDEARVRGTDDTDLEEQLNSWCVQFSRRRHLWLTAESALGDLRSLLIGPQSRQQRTWNWLASATGWVFDHYLAVASLVAAIATAFYGLAYSRFYSSLGITPEQAGITPTQIFTHSAVGGLTLTALFSIGLYCLLGPTLPVRDDAAAHLEAGRGADVLANAGLTTLGGLVLFIVLVLVDAPASLIAVLEVMLVVIFGLSTLRPGIGRNRRRGIRPLRFGSERYLIGAVVAIAFGLFIAGFVTLAEAGNLGSRVSRGEAVGDPKIMGVPFLGVRAEPALVSWTGRRPPGANMPHCAFYLGTSDGSGIFYDHRSRGTFHVPADAVTVDVRAEMSSCEAPANATPPSIHVRRGSLACVPGRWHTYMPPRFTYEWLSDGIQIKDHDGPPARFLEPNDWRGLALRCRVTASTLLGEDTVVSRRILVPPWIAERDVRSRPPVVPVGR